MPADPNLSTKPPNGSPLTAAVRVLIADPHPVARAGVRAVAERAGLTVVGEAVNGSAALRLATDLAPGLLVIEDDLPRLSGPSVIARALRAVPGLRAVVLAADGSAERVAACQAAGAAAFVHKRATADELASTLRTVAAGSTPPAFAAVIPSGPLEPTDREEQVVRMVARGYTGKEVASRLGVSVKTVEEYKTRGLRKLGLTDRVELVRYAASWGWLEPEDVAAEAAPDVGAAPAGEADHADSNTHR